MGHSVRRVLAPPPGLSSLLAAGSAGDVGGARRLEPASSLSFRPLRFIAAEPRCTRPLFERTVVGDSNLRRFENKAADVIKWRAFGAKKASGVAYHTMGSKPLLQCDQTLQRAALKVWFLLSVFPRHAILHSSRAANHEANETITRSTGLHGAGTSVRAQEARMHCASFVPNALGSLHSLAADCLFPPLPCSRYF